MGDRVSGEQREETEEQAIDSAARIAHELTGIPVDVIKRQMLALAEKRAPRQAGSGRLQ